MSEWMDNVDKAIGRIMADKVYTSAEFKRERDTFHVREIIRPRRNEATYINCIIVGAGFKCKILKCWFRRRLIVVYILYSTNE